MNNLIKDNSLILEHNVSSFSLLMEKVNLYNRRLSYVQKNKYISESQKHRYSQDILLTKSEQDEVKIFLNEMLYHLTENFNEQIAALNEAIETGIINDNYLNESFNKYYEGLLNEGLMSWAKDKVDAVKKWAKDSVDDLTDKYENVKEFLQKLIDKGIKSVKGFIENVGEIFAKLADKLNEGLRKLGVFKKDDDDEVQADDVKIQKGVDIQEDEQNFFKHVMSYVKMALTDKKDVSKKLIEDQLNININDDELLDEGLIDTIANNKVVQFIFCYGKDKKISWWKSLLISVIGSLTIALVIPVFLEFIGASAIAGTVCAVVAFIWNCRGIVKILLNRYVNWNHVDPFFDKATTIGLVISVLSLACQFPPLKTWVQSGLKLVCEKLGLDKLLDKLGDVIRELAKRKPEEIIKEGTKTILKTIKVEENVVKLDHFAYKVGDEVSISNAKILNKIFNSDAFKDAIEKAGGELVNNGSNSVTLSDGAKAGANFIVKGLTDEQVRQIVSNQLGENSGLMNKVVTKTASIVAEKTIEETVPDLVKEIVPFPSFFETVVSSFNPVFVPILDEKTFGKYKIRYGSNTNQKKGYVVKKVEEMTIKEADDLVSDDVALPKIIKYRQQIALDHISTLELAKKKADEEKDKSKKFDKWYEQEKKKFNKNNQYVFDNVYVIYVEDDEMKDGRPATVIDPLTMLCADLASKRRKNPYFIKGLLSRLSFLPVEKKDNDTKNDIREWWGTTFATAVKQNVSFGYGSIYIKKDKKFIPGGEVENSKEIFELGNLSQNEICEILNDNDKTNKYAYSLLSGKFGSLLSVKKSGRMSARKDIDTIENQRYTKTQDGKFKRDKNGEYDYVDAKILPEILNKEGEIYKKLSDDKDIKKVFFKDDEIREDIFTDKTLGLKDFLYRPESTFSKKDEDKLGEKLKKFRKEKGDSGFWENLFTREKHMYEVFKNAIEIIWDVLNDKVRDKGVNEGYYYDQDIEDLSLFEYMLREEIESIENDDIIFENFSNNCKEQKLFNIKSMKDFFRDKIIFD